MKSSKIKREIYPQGAKVEVEISHKYHKFTYPPYFIHMHTLVWLYASILYRSISWLYNTCVASMPILVIGTPISSTIYTFRYRRHSIINTSRENHKYHIHWETWGCHTIKLWVLFWKLTKTLENGSAKNLRHSAWLDCSVFWLLKTHVKVVKPHG